MSIFKMVLNMGMRSNDITDVAQNAKVYLNRQILEFLGRTSGSHINTLLLFLLKRKLTTPQLLSNHSVESSELLKSSTSTVTAPKFFPDKQKCTEKTHRPLCYHLVKDGVVSAYASGILQGNNLLLPHELKQHRNVQTTDGAGLYQLERGYCVARLTKPDVISKAIFIGGAGAFNWYHFIIELLPKVYLTNLLDNEFSDWPLIVPYECKSIPQYKTALSLFAKNREVIYLRKKEFLKITTLLVLDDVSIAPFNYRDGNFAKMDHHTQHDDFMKTYINELRDCLKIPTNADALKNDNNLIYLARKNSNRKHNQDELIEIAQLYGFRPVYLESMSLHEQYQMIKGANYIISASGAALVSLIYPAEKKKFLSWLPPKSEESCVYSSLAALSGQDLEYLPTIYERDFESTARVHDIPYIVDPVIFEKNLQRIINY